MEKDINNLLSPIFQLPYELLEDILNHLVHWIFEENKDPYKGANSCDFIPFTHICRQIRSIALSSPCLWRYIDISHRRFCEEFFVRSRSAPITLITSSSKPIYIPSCLRVDPTFFQPHGSRIIAVDTYLYWHEMGQLFQMLRSAAPQLSSLRLRSVREPSRDNSPADLDCDLPVLRRLALDGTSVRWNLCANLTYLNLSGWQVMRITYADIRNILTRSPSMEEFHLSSPFDCNLNSLEVIKNGIHLPLLRKMKLSAHWITTSLLLTELDSPLQPTPTTIFRVDYGMGIYLLSTDPPPWSSDPSLIFCSVSVSQFNHGETSQFFTLIPIYFDLSQLTILELKFTEIIADITKLQHFLLSIPSLCTLRINEHFALSVLSALGICGAIPRVPCPNLSRIVLGIPDSGWRDVSSESLAPVVETLQQRGTFLGARLQTLKFIGGRSIDIAAVGLLKSYVDELIIIMPHGKRKKREGKSLVWHAGSAGYVPFSGNMFYT